MDFHFVGHAFTDGRLPVGTASCSVGRGPAPGPGPDPSLSSPCQISSDYQPWPIVLLRKEASQPHLSAGDGRDPQQWHLVPRRFFVFTNNPACSQPVTTITARRQPPITAKGARPSQPQTDPRSSSAQKIGSAIESPCGRGSVAPANFSSCRLPTEVRGQLLVLETSIPGARVRWC